ncbi:MAG: four helix bundle protein [Nitrospinae bacterium]|nr:four helix bundle protein [Nitrospinota bacterium]
MKKFRFLEWQVYKDCRELFSLILKLVRKLPKEYRFELGSQLIRSAFSVILNIAEGSGKNSDKELNRYLDISLGSLHETLAAVDVLKNNKFVTEQEFNEIFVRIDNIADQLGGFKKKLKSTNN